MKHITVSQGSIQWNERHAHNMEELKPVITVIEDNANYHGVSISGNSAVIYEPTGLIHGSRVWIEAEHVTPIPARTVHKDFDPAELDRSRGKRIFGIHLLEEEVLIAGRALSKCNDQPSRLLLERIGRFYDLGNL